MFKEFGELESVAVATDKDDPTKLKDFGYVCYKDHADAEKAEEAMNKKVLPDG